MNASLAQENLTDDERYYWREGVRWAIHKMLQEELPVTDDPQTEYKTNNDGK